MVEYLFVIVRSGQTVLVVPIEAQDAQTALGYGVLCNGRVNVVEVTGYGVEPFPGNFPGGCRYCVVGVPKWITTGRVVFKGGWSEPIWVYACDDHRQVLTRGWGLGIGLMQNEGQRELRYYLMLQM